MTTMNDKLNGLTMGAQALQTLAHVESLLSRVASATEASIEDRQFRFFEQPLQEVAADGTAQFNFESPPGVSWQLKRANIIGTTAAGSGAFMYFRAVTAGTLINVFANGQGASVPMDDFYVPENNVIIIRLFSQTPGEMVGASMHGHMYLQRPMRLARGSGQ